MDETDVPYNPENNSATVISEDEAVVQTPHGERYRTLQVDKSGLPNGEPYSLTEQVQKYYDDLLCWYDEIF